MKRFLISMLCVSLLGCASGNVHPVNSVPMVTPPVTPPAPVTPKVKTIASKNGAVQVPYSWEAVASEDDGSNVILYASPEHNSVVSLMTEDYNGAPAAYVQNLYEQLTEQGAKLIEARRVTINEVDFMLIKAIRNTTISWVWVTAQHGYGFGLVCGGPAFDETIQEICTDIGNSIVLN